MYLHSHLLVNMFLNLAHDSQIICAVMPTGKKRPLEICANDCQLSCHCHMKNLQLSLKQHQLVALLVSLQHLLNQCWNSSIPVAIDGGVVVQFGARPRRRRQQQSFGDTFGDTLGCIVSTLWSKHVSHCSHVYVLVKCTCQRTVPSHE